MGSVIMKINITNPLPNGCCYEYDNISIDYVKIDSVDTNLDGEIILYHQMSCQECHNDYETYWCQELYTLEDWSEKLDQIETANKPKILDLNCKQPKLYIIRHVRRLHYVEFEM